MNWLGMIDSNYRVLESKTSALPLGESPLLLVGKVGIEPTVYLTCLIYSQRSSPTRLTYPCMPSCGLGIIYMKLKRLSYFVSESTFNEMKRINSIK